MKREEEHQSRSGDKDPRTGVRYGTTSYETKKVKKNLDNGGSGYDFSWLEIVAEAKRKLEEKQKKEEVLAVPVKKLAEIIHQVETLKKEMPLEPRLEEGVHYRVGKKDDNQVMALRAIHEREKVLKSRALILAYSALGSMKAGAEETELAALLPELGKQLEGEGVKEIAEWALTRSRDAATATQFTKKYATLSLAARSLEGKEGFIEASQKVRDWENAHASFVESHPELRTVLRKVTGEAEEKAQLIRTGKQASMSDRREEIAHVMALDSLDKIVDGITSTQRVDALAARLCAGLNSTERVARVGEVISQCASRAEREEVVAHASALSGGDLVAILNAKQIGEKEDRAVKELLSTGMLSTQVGVEYLADRALKTGITEGISRSSGTAPVQSDFVSPVLSLMPELELAKKVELQKQLLEAKDAAATQMFRDQALAQVITLSARASVEALLHKERIGGSEERVSVAMGKLTEYCERLYKEGAPKAEIEQAIERGRNRAPAQLRSILDASEDIHLAAQGHFISWGTDQERFFGTLMKLSGEEKELVQRVHKQKHGKSIEAVIDEEFGTWRHNGAERAKAYATLAGDSVRVRAADAAIALSGAWVGSGDGAAVAGIIRSLKTSEDKARFASILSTEFGTPLAELTDEEKESPKALETLFRRSRLSEVEKEKTLAAWSGNDALYTARRLQSEFGAFFKVDAKVVGSIIEEHVFDADGRYDATRAAALVTEFNKLYEGKTQGRTRVPITLERELSKLSTVQAKEWVQAMLVPASGRPEREISVEIAAKKIQYGLTSGITSGAGWFHGDSSLVNDALTGTPHTISAGGISYGRSVKDPQFKEAVIARVEALSGKEFARTAALALSADDYKVTENVVAQGQLTDADVFFKATLGKYGTDEAAALAVLRKYNRSQETRDQFDKEFSAKYGKSVTTTIDSELAGAAKFDATELWVFGAPKNAKEKEAALARRREFENALPSAMQMVVSPALSSIRLARQVTPWQKKMNAEFDTFNELYVSSNGTSPDLDAAYERSLSAADRCREYNNIAADTAATVGSTVVLIGVTAAVTVGTGGTGTAATLPLWQAALVGTGASLAARSGVKMAIKGHSYEGLEEFAQDTGYSVIDGGAVLLGGALTPLREKIMSGLIERTGEKALAQGTKFIAREGTEITAETAGRAIIEGGAINYAGFADESLAVRIGTRVQAAAGRAWHGAKMGAVDGVIIAPPVAMSYTAITPETWDNGTIAGIGRVGLSGVYAAPFGAIAGGVTGGLLFAKTPGQVARMLSRSDAEEILIAAESQTGTRSVGDISPAELPALRMKLKAQGYLTVSDINDARIAEITESIMKTQRDLSIAAGVDKNYHLPITVREGKGIVPEPPAPVSVESAPPAQPVATVEAAPVAPLDTVKVPVEVAPVVRSSEPPSPKIQMESPTPSFNEGPVSKSELNDALAKLASKGRVQVVEIESAPVAPRNPEPTTARFQFEVPQPTGSDRAVSRKDLDELLGGGSGPRVRNRVSRDEPHTDEIGTASRSSRAQREASEPESDPTPRRRVRLDDDSTVGRRGNRDQGEGSDSDALFGPGEGDTPSWEPPSFTFEPPSGGFDGGTPSGGGSSGGGGKGLLAVSKPNGGGAVVIEEEVVEITANRIAPQGPQNRLAKNKPEAKVTLKPGKVKIVVDPEVTPGQGDSVVFTPPAEWRGAPKVAPKTTAPAEVHTAPHKAPMPLEVPPSKVTPEIREAQKIIEEMERRRLIPHPEPLFASSPFMSAPKFEPVLRYNAPAIAGKSATEIGMQYSLHGAPGTSPHSATAAGRVTEEEHYDDGVGSMIPPETKKFLKEEKEESKHGFDPHGESSSVAYYKRRRGRIIKKKTQFSYDAHDNRFVYDAKSAQNRSWEEDEV